MTDQQPEQVEEPDAKVIQQQKNVERAGQEFMNSVMEYFTLRFVHESLMKDRKADPEDIFPAAQAHREAEATMKQQIDRFYEVFTASVE